MFPLIRLRHFVRHIILAKSRHGTHSPFVYRLLENVVYARKPDMREHTKVERLVVGLIADRLPSSLLLVGQFSPSLISIVSKRYPHVYCLQVSADKLPQNTRFDLVFCQKIPVYNEQLWTTLAALLHEQSAFVLSPLYRCPDSVRFWKNFITWRRATVTIDMYYSGLVFFHDGQAKEHFMIRHI